MSYKTNHDSFHALTLRTQNIFTLHCNALVEVIAIAGSLERSMARALSKRFFFECSLCPGALGDTASLLASGGTLAVHSNAQLLYSTHQMHPFAPTIKVSQKTPHATFTQPCTNTIPVPTFCKGKKKIGIFRAETTRPASGKWFTED